MKITRKFTQAGSDPFASVQWVKRSSKISNPDGSVVFEMKDAEEDVFRAAEELGIDLSRREPSSVEEV